MPLCMYSDPTHSTFSDVKEEGQKASVVYVHWETFLHVAHQAQL